MDTGDRKNTKFFRSREICPFLITGRIGISPFSLTGNLVFVSPEQFFQAGTGAIDNTPQYG